MTQKILDEKKICFIIAVNDEEKFASCVDWIKKLKVPRGMKLSIQAMRGFSSMTSAYQAAMEKSDAKYKIYIHQDVYCIHKNMLEKLIKLFRSNPRFGLLGVIGAKILPNDAVWWSCYDNVYGKIGDHHIGDTEIYRYLEIKKDIEEAEVVDGVFLATQYDLDWRTEIFDNFHYYDISQCKEYNRAGYKVGIVRQEKPWCHHYDTKGEKDEQEIKKAKSKFLEEYMWGMSAKNIAPNLEREPLTDIVILSYNTLDMTKLCIESIRRYTEPGTYQIIVIDNASTDGSVEYLKEQTDIKCIFNEENAGFPKGCNQGIELATGTEILLLNSDTIVTPRWLAQLRYALYKSEKTGAVSCMTNNCSNYQALTTVQYKNLQEMWHFADTYNKSDEAKWIPNFRLVGFCMLIKREVVDKIGGLDERFTTGNYEDDDYSFRIREAGYDLLLCKDTFIHHFGSASFTKSKTKEEQAEKIRQYEELASRNKKYFCEKWQTECNYDEIQSIIDEFPQRVPQAERIIHIGCRYGKSLFRLKEKYPQAEFSGIAFSERATELTGWGFDVTYCNSVEDNLFDCLSGKYDLIYISNLPCDFQTTENICVKLKEYMASKGMLCFVAGERAYFIR